MRSREFEEVTGQSRKVMTILWGAMLASVALYVVVAYIATPANDTTTEVPDALPLALTVAALGAAAAAFVIPSRLLSEDRLRDHMQSESFELWQYAKDPQTGGVDQARVEKLEKLSGLEQRLATASMLYFTPWLVGLALTEAIAVFGLVLAFMTGEPDAILPFAAAAAGLLVLKRPRFENWFLRLERYAR